MQKSPDPLLLDIEDPFEQRQPQPTPEQQNFMLDVPDPFEAGATEPSAAAPAPRAIPATASAIPRADRSIVGELTGGIKRSVPQFKETFSNVAGAIGAISGIEPLKQYGLSKAQEYAKEAKAVAPPAAVPSIVESWNKGTTLQDLPYWLANEVGEQAMNIGETALTAIGGAAIGSAIGPGGTLGGLIAGAGGKGVIKKMAAKTMAEIAEDAVKKGATKEAAQTFAANQSAKLVGRKLGAMAGMVAGTVPLEWGGSYGEQVEKGMDGPKAALTTLGTAIPAAMLELAGGSSRFIGKILNPSTKAEAEAAQGIFKRFGKNLLGNLSKQMPEEFLQEAGQEFFSVVASKLNDPSVDLASRESMLRYLESGLAGAGIGGVFGFGGATIDSLKKQEQVRQPKRQAPSAIPVSAQAEAPTTAIPEPDTDIVPPGATVEPGQPIDLLSPDKKTESPHQAAEEEPLPLAPLSDEEELIAAEQRGAIPAVAEVDEERAIDLLNPAPVAMKEQEAPSDVLTPTDAPAFQTAIPQPIQTMNVPESADVLRTEAPERFSDIDMKAQDAATSPLNAIPQPTEAQKEAGNYQKGHISLQGLDISIENPAGSVRSGKDKDGKEWESTLSSHYGYIRGTKGKDKDHIDTFIGPNPDSQNVFVVNQVNPKSGAFDEHKVMIGFNSEEEARQGYLANYEQGWQGLKSIAPMSMDQFKGWLKGDTTKEVRAKPPSPVPSMTVPEKAPELRQERQKRAIPFKKPEPAAINMVSYINKKGGLDIGNLQGEFAIIQENNPQAKLLKVKGGKWGVDQMAQMAHVEGLIKEPTPQALMDAISGKSVKTSSMVEKEIADKEVIYPDQLQEGQKVIIDGEEYVRDGINEKGEVILKDGIDKEVDIFEPLTVDKVFPVKKADTKTVRFDAGKKLTKEQRAEVLRQTGDSYKDLNAPKEMKGIDRRGEEIIGYEYDPEYMHTSDITGRKIRFYITMPDGRKAHPSELYPNITKSEVDRAMLQEKYRQEQERLFTEQDIEAKRNRIARQGEDYMAGDIKNESNRLYARTGRKIENSYFAQNDRGDIVRIDGKDQADIEFYEKEGFKPLQESFLTPPEVKQKPKKAEQTDIFGALSGTMEGKIPAKEGEFALGKAAEEAADRRAEAEMMERQGKIPEAETKTEAKVEAQMTSPIEDFGEKIGGARKDIAERGFTKGEKKQDTSGVEPWKKKYVVMEKVDGSGWTIGKRGDRIASFAIGRSQVFATQEEAEKAIPLIAIAESHRVFQDKDKTYAIFKKVGDRKLFKVVNKSFESREDGMRYMAEHAEEILNVKTTFGEEILPVPEIAVRKGVERRTEPATPEMFIETFAPRGIEFGNWTNQEERQQVMDHAYDGLLDLAEVLDVPPKALMLNGDLAIAFGARGQGLLGAKAHYERDYGVINLTKMKGAGSLAHEWFHALDHYFGRSDTKASSEKEKNERGDMVYKASSRGRDYLSHGESYKSKLRPEVQESYKNLMETMYRKAEQYVEDTKVADQFLGRARENLRKEFNAVRQYLLADYTQWKKKGGQPASSEQIAEFDRLADSIVEGGNLETKWVKAGKSRFGGRYSNDTLEAINALIKAVRNRQGFNSERSGYLDQVRAAMGTYKGRLKMFEDAKAGTEKTKKVPTSFAIEAKKMDQARTNDYWSEPHEMAARAFASYVEDKIAENGGQSDFLVYHAHGGIFLPMIDGFVARPYPEGKEREAINKAFDEFVGTLKTKETDKGTAMYSIAEDQTETPEFKRWFGDSKVVDEKGEPKVVYHGTAADFSAFDRRKVGSNYGRDNVGFFFTDDKGEAVYASEDAAKGKRGGKVLSVYLSMQNPIVHETKWFASEYFDQKGGWLLNKATEEGNDGVIIRGDGSNLYIAFSPEQIKSATGNRGTYDPNRPEIDLSVSPARMKIPPDKLREILREINRIIAPGSRVELKETITPGSEKEMNSALAQWGKGNLSASKIRIKGRHSIVPLNGEGFRSLIELSLTGMDESTPYHEAFHSVQRLLLTESEIQALERAFPDEGKKKSIEVQADAFAAYVLGKKVIRPLTARRIFDRISTFLTKLKNALNGMGFRTAEDIFEKAYQGEFRKRALREREALEGADYDIVSETGGPAGERAWLEGERITDLGYDTESGRLFRENLSGVLGRSVDKDSVREVSLQGKNSEALKGIAGKFDKKVRFFKATDPEISLYMGAMVENDPKSIYINVDSAAPHLQVLGHELFHHLAADNPALFSDFYNQIKGEINNFAYGQYRQLAASARMYRDENQLFNEFGAEFIGQKFLDTGFWEAMQAKNPSLVSKVMNYVKNLLDKAVQAFGRDIQGAFLKDIDRARGIAADIMSKYAKNQQVGKTPADYDTLLSMSPEEGAGKPTGKNPDMPEGGSIISEIVYHGGPAREGTFKIGVPSPRDSRYKNATISFTTDRRLARRYAGKKGTVTEHKIVLKNPIDLGDGDATMTIATFLKKINSPLTAEQLNLNPTGWVEQWRMVTYNPEIVKILSDLGYDGAMWKENKGKSLTYHVFSPSQIKDISNKPLSPPKGGGEVDLQISDAESEAPKADPRSVTEFYNSLLQRSGLRLNPKVKNRIRKDMSLLNRFVNTPKYIADKFREFAPVFRGAQSIYQKRDEHIAELLGKVQDYMALSPESKAKVDKTAEYYTLQNEVPKNDDLIAQGLDNTEIRAFWSLKDTYNAAWDKIADLYVKMGGDEKVIREEMGRIKFYVPLSRFGEWAVSHKDKDGNLTFETFESEFKAKIYANKLVRGGKEVSVDKLTNMARGSALEGLDMFTLSALARFADISPDVADPFLEQAKEFLKARGFKKHFIERKGTAGYSQDWVRVHSDYIVGLSNYLARIEGLSKMKDSIGGIDARKTPQLYRYAQNYIKYMENPKEEAAKLRGGLFLYYLGANVKSAVLNLTQPITTSMPYLSQYTKKGSAELMKAAKDVAKAIRMKDGVPFFDGSTLEPNLAEALSNAVETTNEQMIYELMAVSRGEMLTKEKARVARALAYMFGTAETWNRRVTFIAAFRIGKELETKKALPKDFTSAADFAEKAVENSQFIYGRYNRPTIARGPVGATFFTFKTFMLQYMELLSNLAKNDKVAFSKAMGIMFLLAGLGGLPFMDDLKKLFERMFGINLDAKARDIGNDLFGSPEFGEVMLKGITRLGPVDMSGAIGVGDLIPEVDTISILGPAGGILQRFAKTAPYVERQQYMRAAETIAPEAIRNPLAALRIANEGQRDVRGQLVFSGEGRWGKATNVGAKALSFQPSDLARAQERERAQAMIGGKRAEKKRAFVDRIARAYVERDTEEVVKIRREIREYNQSKPKEQRIILTRMNVRDAIRRLRLPEDASGMRFKAKQERSEYLRLKELFL